jgi:ADP-ribose pyrophosphatase YjhB (NUDIX family)
VLVPQGDIEQIMEEFKAFKKNVPVMGAILLDQDMQRVLLVKGWKNTACWGFPRGKIHKNETDAQCAVREVRLAHMLRLLALSVHGTVYA